MNESSKKENLKTALDRAGDYTVKKDKKIDLIIRILSILAAIVIWVYVVSTDVATNEFKNIQISLRGVETVTKAGYSVEYSNMYLNVKVQGSANKINQTVDGSITAYADITKLDLSEIVGSKLLNVPVKLDLPRGLTCIEQSRDNVFVTISVKQDR